MTRMGEERIARIHGKRKRCEDEVRQDVLNLLGMKTWKMKARDRDLWRRSIGEAKAQIGL